MKSLLTVICAIFISVMLCNAQTTEKPKPNAISFELGKTGLIYNLIFDHKLTNKNLGFRFGAGSNFAKYLNAISAGGGGYYLSGRTNHSFEVGVDLQYLVVYEGSDNQKRFIPIYPNYSTNTYFLSINLGYRAYSKRSLFRVGVSPGSVDGDFALGVYISYGLRF
jgi:hypothetical protein